MKRVVVLGLMGQYPLAGMAWQVLHYVLGFRRLGCDCIYVENSGAPPYSPRRFALAEDARENVRFLRDTFRRFELAGAWAYYDCISERWFGMGREQAADRLATADVIVNLCGSTLPEPGAPRRGCLVYLETDPVLEQVKLASGDPDTRAMLEAHDVHFTYAWNLGAPTCPLATGDIEWRRTHPPVLADLWESPPRPRGAWRTVATYHNQGRDVVIDGRTYLWSKRPSFERVLDLPRRTGESLELALAAPESVRERFRAHGWSVRDPYPISRGAARYRRWIQAAKGEFSVEKQSVTALRTGWFSDRSVCFLAAGRPCVIEDTGFGTRLPAGAGLVAWSSVDEAAAALEAVARDYDRHARAARALAREYFEASVLLPALLEAAGA